MTDKQTAARQAALAADMTRSQAIILQSNTRASGIAQLLAAILTLVGVATALFVSLGDKQVTLLTTVFGWLAAVGLLASLLGLANVMWPRLGRLPRERSLQDFQRRINDAADARDSSESLDYEQGYDLQAIAFAKERGTQATLAGMVVLATCSIIAFGIQLLS